MTLFAHVETGKALDVQPNTSAAEYRARYTVEVTAGWDVVQVPNGTEHGAVDNHDGTFTNPSSTPVPSADDSAAQLKAITRTRATELADQGKHAEALYLLSTIGE